MRPFLPFAVVALIAGCSAPRPAPAPSPAPVATPLLPPPRPAAVGPDWRDWPVTPGIWNYRQDARGSIALFGPANSEAMVALRCDRAARRLYLSRAGGQAATLTLRTTSLTRLLSAVPTGNVEEPFIAVALQPSDPLLDAMGFSRGHFVIEQPGVPPVVLPAWAEIERVTQDCRG